MNIKRITIISALILIITIPAIIISCTNPLQDIIKNDIIEAADLQISSEPPVAPSDLKATAMSTSQIDLTWIDNSDNETEFHIQRKLAGATEWQTIETIGADSTTYSDTGLAAETEYTYRVRAANTGGNSEWTEEVTERTISLSAPGAPSTPDLAAADDSGYSDSDNITNKTTDLTFTGTAEAGTTVSLYSDIDGYLGEFSTLTGNWQLNVSLIEATHIIISIATKDGESSGPSDGLSITIDTTPPAETPSILKPMQGTNTGTNLNPTFTWVAASDANIYEIEADDDSSFSGIEPFYKWSYLSGTSFCPQTDMATSDTQPVGTRYYLRIRGVDLAGNTGSWSNSDMLRYVNVGRFDQDFNGDGYSDIIAGAPYYNEYTGAAYIYYGGSLIDNNSDVTITGFNSWDLFGYSVAAGGDVNGDGYADAIVGAFGSEDYTGTAYVFYGGETMNNTADVTMYGDTEDDKFSYSVDAAGDVNSDGYADIIVGAYGNDNFADNAGASYIFLGGASMDNKSDVTLNGEAGNDRFGETVAFSGDVNGDGYNDVIVGASGNDAANNAAGSAYIFYGGASMNKVADISIYGKEEGERFGNSVSTAGDVNGDGYADVIIGACHNEKIADNAGAAYIFYGGETMNNTADVTMYGEVEEGQFGVSVATGGDINGDGYYDTIVGASTNIAVINSPGTAYIFNGGFSMNNSPDETLYGLVDNDTFGSTVTSAGDYNGDGYDDPIVAAAFGGTIYVFFGSNLFDSTYKFTITSTTSGIGCSVD